MKKLDLLLGQHSVGPQGSTYTYHEHCALEYEKIRASLREHRELLVTHGWNPDMDTSALVEATLTALAGIGVEVDSLVPMGTVVPVEAMPLVSGWTSEVTVSSTLEVWLMATSDRVYAMRLVRGSLVPASAYTLVEARELVHGLPAPVRLAVFGYPDTRSSGSVMMGSLEAYLATVDTSRVTISVDEVMYRDGVQTGRSLLFRRGG